MEHTWTRSRFTGTTTYERCGLLPLDSDDCESECVMECQCSGCTGCDERNARMGTRALCQAGATEQTVDGDWLCDNCAQSQVD